MFGRQYNYGKTFRSSRPVNGAMKPYERSLYNNFRETELKENPNRQEPEVGGQGIFGDIVQNEYENTRMVGSDQQNITLPQRTEGKGLGVAGGNLVLPVDPVLEGFSRMEITNDSELPAELLKKKVISHLRKCKRRTGESRNKNSSSVKTKEYSLKNPSLKNSLTGNMKIGSGRKKEIHSKLMETIPLILEHFNLPINNNLSKAIKKVIKSGKTMSKIMKDISDLLGIVLLSGHMEKNKYGIDIGGGSKMLNPLKQIHSRMAKAIYDDMAHILSTNKTGGSFFKKLWKKTKKVAKKGFNYVKKNWKPITKVAGSAVLKWGIPAVAGAVLGPEAIPAAKVLGNVSAVALNRFL